MTRFNFADYGTNRRGRFSSVDALDLSPPIVICGCHGGGTSFTAKLLRYAGLFVGDDAGPRWVRKYHESKTLRHANEEILFEFGGDRNGLTPNGFSRAAAALAHLENVKLAASRIDRMALLREYWGRSQPRPWGWKDPRNSLTFPVWKQLFPDAKALIVTKMIDGTPSRSLAGYRFRHKMSPWLRDAYMHPFWEHDFPETMSVPFEELTRHHTVFNDALKFCGLTSISREEFQLLLRRTRFGKDELIMVRIYTRLIGLFMRRLRRPASRN